MKNDARNKAIHSKLKVTHSDERHGFYRTFKDKSDYLVNHLKSNTIRPRKLSASQRKAEMKRHHDDLLKSETN